MILARFLLAFVALSSFVSANTIYVDVDQGYFSPNIVYGNPGDLVSFYFNAGDNSVSEVSTPPSYLPRYTFLTWHRPQHV